MTLHPPEPLTEEETLALADLVEEKVFGPANSELADPARRELLIVAITKLGVDL